MSLAHVKLALRVLLRRKAFTAISLFGVTLTLLVLVLAASLVDAMFSSASPESLADRSLLVIRVELEGTDIRSSGAPSLRFLERTVRDLQGASDVTIFRESREQAAWVGDRRTNLDVKATDGAFWRVHDFRFLEGGAFGEQDDREGNAVAIVSERTRDRLYGGGPALGRTFELEGRAFRVAGVVANVPTLRMVPHADAWIPLGAAGTNDAANESLTGEMSAVLVAKEDRPLKALQEEFRARVAGIPMPWARYTTIRAQADTRFEAVAREVLPGQSGASSPAPRLRFLMACLALGFMVLPALNLVNLNLSRVLERAPEVGVRKAFGATRRQLIVQFVMENVVLTLVGALLALLLAPLGLAALGGSGAFEAPIPMNVRVLGWGLIFALVFAVLSGAWPAWRMARLPAVDVLRGRLS